MSNFTSVQQLPHVFAACLQADQIRAAVTEYADYNVFTLDYPRPDEPTVHIGAYELDDH